MVRIEIGLLGSAILEGDLALESGSKGKNDGTFHLSFEGVRGYGDTAIDCDNHSMHFDFPLFDGNFGHFRHV
jgi:hypothetical protein